MFTTMLMHPRNLYQTPLDFQELSEQYPVIVEHMSAKRNGKTTFDFKNREALRCLTKILLKRDFDLDVVIPEDKLVPTLPLRLNYILWIEDLLGWSPAIDTECLTPVRGIDIGTGATCIYPLLMAKKNGWKLVGTEIDESSVQVARENVENNRLEHLISVVSVPPSTFLLDVGTNEAFDFCMCNPPFFDRNEGETSGMSRKKNRLKRRRKSEMCVSGSSHEISSLGGEEEFVKNIIRDSLKLRDRIKIYSAMIGCKSSLQAILQTLKELEVESFSTTRFCQGRTIRWAVAWTFTSLSLKSTVLLPHRSKRTSPSNPLGWPVKCKHNFHESIFVLENVLRESEIGFHVIEKSEREIVWNISAFRNTWTGMRRRRREKLRNEKRGSATSGDPPISPTCVSIDTESALLPSVDNPLPCDQSENDKNDLSDGGTASGCQKRRLRSEADVKVLKRLKTGDEGKGNCENNRADNNGPSSGTLETNQERSEGSAVILEAVLRVKDLRTDLNDSEGGNSFPLLLQISLIRGSAETPQQVLQFLKNNLV